MKRHKIDYQEPVQEHELSKLMPRMIFYKHIVIKDSSPIIIDFGSYSIKAGHASSVQPELVIPSVVFKNKDFKGTINVVNSIPENIQFMDILKPNYISPYEKDLIQHFGIQETLLDSILYQLNYQNQEIIITEPLANPILNKQNQVELLFECYQAKSVCFCLDSLMGYYYKLGDQQYKQGSQLVLKFGNISTYVIPIVKGKIYYEYIQKLTFGGSQIFYQFYQNLHLKQDHFKSILNHTHQQGLYEHLSQISLDYKIQSDYFQQGKQVLKQNYQNQIQYENQEYINTEALSSPIIVKLPIHQEHINEEEIEKRNQQKKLQAERLRESQLKKKKEKEQQQRNELTRLENSILNGTCENKIETEKKIEDLKIKLKIISKEDLMKNKFQLLDVDDSQLTKDQLRTKKMQQALKRHLETKRQLKQQKQREKEQQQQLIEQNPEEHKNYLYQRHAKLTHKLQQLNKQKLEASARNSRANQKKMQALANLANENKNSKVDDFGKNDDDWNIYRQVQKGGSNDEEIENVQMKLQELEIELRGLDPLFDEHIHEQTKLPFGLTKESNYFMLHTEIFKPAEGLFNPSIMANNQIGIIQIIVNVIKSFTNLDDQKLLLENIFLTGGVSQLKGLENRIKNDLKQHFPQDFTNISINQNQDPIFDCWKGMQQLYQNNQNDILDKYAFKSGEYFSEGFESYYNEQENPFGNSFN